MEENFEKLEELIKDDDKIATVVSFALDTNISITESKKIIQKYVEINEESKQINITYILYGRKQGDQLSVALVKDNNLKEVKGLYEDEVKLIIFSVQKAKNVDLNVIALVDQMTNERKKEPLCGAIIGKNCIKRVLHKKVLPPLPPATLKGKSTIFTKQNSFVKSENLKVEKDVGDSNTNNKNKANTQGNIASLFSKASQNKKPEQKDEKQLEKKQKSNGNISNFFTKQSSKDLSTKQVEKNEIKAEKLEQKQIKSGCNEVNVNNVEKNKDNSINDKKQDKKSDLYDSDTDDEILKDLEIKEEKSPEKKSENKKDQAKTSHSKKKGKKADLLDSDSDDEILKDVELRKEKGTEKKSEKKKEPSKTNLDKSKNSQKKKRGKHDVGNDKSIKKRRRIIVKDESDSDDIFGSEKSDNEDIVEESDEEPVKEVKRPLAPKNKRRKAVEKMYQDEDGYIVTKTEYVYETPSEDENEPDNKIAKVEEKPKPKIEKKGSNNSENDISPNKGTKKKKETNKKAPPVNQPTLMNFFKKK